VGENRGDRQRVASCHDPEGVPVTQVQYAPPPLSDTFQHTDLFYSSDYQGNIREVTDSAGAIRARYDYDPDVKGSGGALRVPLPPGTPGTS